MIQVVGDDVENTTGTVLSVSQVTGLVTVKLDPEVKGQYSPRYSDTIEVPCTRVQPSRNKVITVKVDGCVSKRVSFCLFFFPKEDNSSRKRFASRTMEFHF